MRQLTSTPIPGPSVDAPDVLRAVQQERAAPVPEWHPSPAARQLGDLRQVIGLLRKLLADHHARPCGRRASSTAEEEVSR